MNNGMGLHLHIKFLIQFIKHKLIETCGTGLVPVMLKILETITHVLAYF